jgi:hypothetical protein
MVGTKVDNWWALEYQGFCIRGGDGFWIGGALGFLDKPKLVQCSFQLGEDLEPYGAQKMQKFIEHNFLPSYRVRVVMCGL